MFTHNFHRIQNGYNTMHLEDKPRTTVSFKAKRITFELVYPALSLLIIVAVLPIVGLDLNYSDQIKNNNLIIVVVICAFIHLIGALSKCISPASIIVNSEGILLSHGGFFSFTRKFFKWDSIHHFEYEPESWRGRHYQLPTLRIHEKDKVSTSFSLSGHFHRDMDYFSKKLNAYANLNDGDVPYIHDKELINARQTHNFWAILALTIAFGIIILLFSYIT